MYRYLIFLFVSFLSLSSSATHLMGGEATARHLGGYDFELTLINYRDVSGIAMQNYADVSVLDSVGNELFESDIHGYEFEGMLPLLSYGVEIYKFTDTITVPGPGEYNIAWTNCCRNGSIVNASAPLSNSIFVYVTITAFDSLSGESNSSPVFLTDPVVVLPVRYPWAYNPLPFDVDGDSLVLSIVKPLDAFGVPIGGWYPPPAVDSTVAMMVDQEIGMVTWTPKIAGNFVASIQVDEYRDGKKIGTILRDLQLIVVIPTDSVPEYVNLDDFIDTTSTHITEFLFSGSSYSLTLIGRDDDFLDSLRMEAFGEQFILENSPATFSYGPNGLGNQIAGIMNWYPIPDHVRSERYIGTFRLDDYIFATDVSMLFYVRAGVGIDGNNNVVNKESYLNVNPNPSSGTFLIRLEMDKPGKGDISIYNSKGQAVFQLEKELHAGINSFLIDRQFDKGQYWVETITAQGKAVKPLLIIR